MKTLAFLIGSLCGVGRAPFASGTWGTLAALLCLLGAAGLVPVPAYPFVLVGGILVFLLAGTWAAFILEKSEGTRDPSVVVVDEACGTWLTFLFIPPGLLLGVWWLTPAGFFLFRFFDIFKIYPANTAEKLPGGWGIMLDDVISGLYACLVLNLLVKQFLL